MDGKKIPIPIPPPNSSRERPLFRGLRSQMPTKHNKEKENVVKKNTALIMKLRELKCKKLLGTYKSALYNTTNENGPVTSPERTVEIFLQSEGKGLCDIFKDKLIEKLKTGGGRKKTRRVKRSRKTRRYRK